MTQLPMTAPMTAPMTGPTPGVAAGLVAILALLLGACDDESGSSRDARSIEPVRISVADAGNASWPPPDSRPDNVIETGGPESAMIENDMVVLDMSGSMADGSCAGSHNSRASAAKKALLSWISGKTNGAAGTTGPSRNIGLVSFSNGEIALDAPLGSGAAHGQMLVDAIDALSPDGGTPLRSAMEAGMQELEAQGWRQGGAGTYRLIVITDGAADTGEDPGTLLDEILANPANPVEVYSIGFCIEGGHSLNDPNAVFYMDANSPEELASSLAATSAEASDFDPDDIEFEALTVSGQAATGQADSGQAAEPAQD